MEYQYKEINGIKVAYLDEGEGVPVFFIPPWTSSHIAYEGITKLLKDSPVRCIRMDLPGWGGATKQKMVKKDFDSYVKLVADFINSFGCDDYTVLGYSLGATFLLNAISRGLIKPSKMVVVSSFKGKSSLTVKDSVLKRNLRFASLAVKYKIPGIILKPLLGSFYYFELISTDMYRRNARYYMKLINSSITSDRDSVMVPLLTLGDPDPEGIKAYKGKSMVIYNSEEPWYFKEFSQEIADLMNVSPTIVSGFRHRYFSFQPESAVSYIKDFILN